MKSALLKNWVAPAAAGGLLTLCFAPYNLWFCAFPAALILLNVFQFGKVKPALAQGWAFGLGLFGSGASWVYVSIHEHGNASAVLAFILTAAFVAGIALFPMLQFAITARLTRKRLSPGLEGLVFIAMWVLFEWVRSWLLTGFPWLFLGVAFIETPLAGWAPILGVYGVAFLLWLSCHALNLSYRNRKSLTTLACATALIVGAWGGGALLQPIEWTTPRGEPIQVSMVQANIAQEVKWLRENREVITETYLTLTEPLWDSDLIIWPETALPYFSSQAGPLLKQLDKQAKENNAALMMGILSADRGEDARINIYNSFIALGQGEGSYNKQKLVPFGEYVPLESWLRGLIDFFNLPMSSMQKGSPTQTPIRFRNATLMPFICYEVVYPDFVAKLAQEPELLVTVSNDSWFGASIGPHQHLQIAQMRALENDKYMLRSTNNGITAIIDPHGRIASRAPQFQATTLSGKVELRQGATPFSRLGSWPILIIATLLLAGALLLGRREQTEAPAAALEQAG
ncbi:apolipoprotein N-acyltransferase [Hahella sp. KA22]|uniref:apolipoprotein N-acyltransferase n=1 Tax=Hahella sp. KA22 TaxID=1628392 RepID=UPI000FDCE1E3|nr:apolipoprotein N-acyltransferase [Hahella sp. KA22]AZZ90827.1 apolipoprotein N-acyltransferase [Hahella sp. KA22]QAY54197.1 apolipoprotein N-acyltransferase [Hahella sp. KA22]